MPKLITLRDTGQSAALAGRTVKTIEVRVDNAFHSWAYRDRKGVMSHRDFYGSRARLLQHLIATLGA